MANKKVSPGPREHDEGMPGDQTHRGYAEQLEEGAHGELRTNGTREDAEVDENVLGHARVPHEGDSR